MMLNTLGRCTTMILLGLALGATPADAAADAAKDAHEAISCRACHRSAGSAAAATSLADADRDRTCLGCHGGLAPAAVAPQAHARRDCSSCHLFHDPGTVTTAVGTLALADLEGVDPAHCAGCHATGSPLDLSEAHRTAGRLYHENAAMLADVEPSRPCLWCHSRSSGSPWQQQPEAQAIAFAEHASHPFGMVVEPGQGAPVRRIRDKIDARIPLPNGRLECISCHELTATTKDRIIPFADPKGLCLGCHDLGPKSGGDGVLLASLSSR